MARIASFSLRSHDVPLSLGTNFDPSLVEGAAKLGVSELYGRLTYDAVGGGRASYLALAPGRRKLAEHVKHVQSFGMSFNYLLNAACLDNREFTRRGQMKIRELLEWIESVGIHHVTVTIPYLLEIIKKHNPNLHVKASAFSEIDSVRKAKFWEDLGADAITLSPLSFNRNLAGIREAATIVKVPLQVIVNNNCLFSCPNFPYHGNVFAHASQSGHKLRGFVLDYCTISCRLRRFLDPTEIMSGDWIRPEDLGFYEKLGVSWFKIVNRNAPTKILLQRAEAYSKRHFEGNLLILLEHVLDSLQATGVKQRISARNWLRLAAIFFRPMSAHISQVKKISKDAMLGPAGAYLDNSKLEGFIEGFLDKSCKATSCTQCGYCAAWAKKALQVDEAYRRSVLDKYNDIKDMLVSGSAYGVKSDKGEGR